MPRLTALAPRVGCQISIGRKSARLGRDGAAAFASCVGSEGPILCEASLFMRHVGAAFFGDVPIERGRAMSTIFDDYRLIRNREAPATIEVIVLPSTLRPTGMGEIGIPPIAPAVANAIAALTGARIREMPFIRAGFDLTASRA